MCGIAGVVDPEGVGDVDLDRFDRALRHRGPDGAGRHVTDLVALVHRRLAILDLTPAGHQPMIRGAVAITYNGEVYNFRELRADLEQRGVVFRSESDTEVVLEAYRAWGIACVARFRGMFAFAISDVARGKVYLVRDHLGVKPLYYASVGRRWTFASELKALGVRADLDREAIGDYLRFLWIPGARTGLRGVAKLEPGTWLEIDVATSSARTQRYWTPQRTSGEHTVEELRELVARSVREQLVSDVPLGAFLSGGLDSSLVVALMNRPVTTYSVGYRAGDLAYEIVSDDAPYARMASAALGTEHTAIELAPDVAALLPKVVEALDEPLGDPAALSSYLICRAARSKVMLGGVGADELFGGYPRQRAMLYGGWYRRAPSALRALVRRGVARMPGAGRGRWARVGRAGKKFLDGVERSSLEHYLAMESYLEPGDWPGSSYAQTKLAEIVRGTSDPLEQAMQWDLETYLPNLNLAYTDRTSMAHGVEVRVPYLDLRIVEWALGLRARDRIRWHRGSLEGKWILKQAAAPYLPSQIIWRKKAGFGAPVRSWLRGELREMRGELLRAIVGRGWFEARVIDGLVADFEQGRADHSLEIWMLMSLELWARRFYASTPAS